jgi:hypothetical protein
MDQIVDLLVLVPDTNIRETFKSLLARTPSLGTSEFTFDFIMHQKHDPGVFNGSGEILRAVQDEFRFALVVLDTAWAGSPGNSADTIAKIERDLERCCLNDRVGVVAIEPELEVWLWSDSPKVYSEIGLQRSEVIEMANHDDRSWWPEDALKPSHPKELLEEVLVRSHRPRSSSLYGEVARKVSLSRCRDSQFVRLKRILQEWFPIVD